MSSTNAEPWLPPADPDLGRLAMEAADAEDLGTVRAWPELRGNGLVFGGLPPFLCWRGESGGAQQLVLLQARELGAVVPGARHAPLPEGWLRDLDLEALALPLRRHPDFPGGTAVHVLRVAGRQDAWVRGTTAVPEALLEAVLARLTGLVGWRIQAEDPAGR